MEMYGSFAMDGYERAFRMSNEPDRSPPYSHATSRRRDTCQTPMGLAKILVNLRSVEEIDINTLEIEEYDGKNVPIVD